MSYVTVKLGNEITPHTGDASLIASPVLDVQVSTARPYANFPRPDGSSAYFAERETGLPNDPEDDLPQSIDAFNDVVFYWMEEGGFGIQWPKFQDRYWQRWPKDTELEDYAHYTTPRAGAPPPPACSSTPAACRRSFIRTTAARRGAARRANAAARRGLRHRAPAPCWTRWTATARSCASPPTAKSGMSGSTRRRRTAAASRKATNRRHQHHRHGRHPPDSRPPVTKSPATSPAAPAIIPRATESLHRRRGNRRAGRDHSGERSAGEQSPNGVVVQESGRAVIELPAVLCAGQGGHIHRELPLGYDAADRDRLGHRHGRPAAIGGRGQHLLSK